MGGGGKAKEANGGTESGVNKASGRSEAGPALVGTGPRERVQKVQDTWEASEQSAEQAYVGRLVAKKFPGLGLFYGHVKRCVGDVTLWFW